MTAVISTEVLNLTCAAVVFTGARGGQNEIIVHLNRRGSVAFGFGERGALSGYLKPGSVPLFVQDAAMKALQGA